MTGHRELMGFLPAALEIERTPPLPGARLILWSVMAVFALGVAWACVGRVDIVAVADGKIVPRGQVKTVQARETGVLRALHVSEGQAVSAGELLFELDDRKPYNELRRLRVALAAAEIETARLDSQVLTQARYATSASYLVQADPRDRIANGVSMSPELLNRVAWALDEHYAERGALEAAIRENRAERRAAQRRLELLDETLPLMSARASAVKQLEQRALAPHLTWLDLEIPRIERERERHIVRAGFAVTDAQASALERRLAALIAGARSNWLEARARAAQERDTTALAIEQIRRDIVSRQLRAPVDGTVQQLNIHTIGGVVTPAQALMQLVPRDVPLALDVRVSNKDIGFVHAGQRVEIKITTFPFTKYGTIPGRVESVSRDAIADERLGLVYLAQISMAQMHVADGERLVPLVPGMAATAEIKLGRRRLIEFLAAPLLQHAAEGFQER